MIKPQQINDINLHLSEDTSYKNRIVSGIVNKIYNLKISRKFSNN